MSRIKEINDEIAKLRDEKARIIQDERKARKSKREIIRLDESANLSNRYTNGLVKQRHTLGLTQTALAEATHMSRTALNNIETGKSDPSLERFLRLNTVLKYWEINTLLEEQPLNR